MAGSAANPSRADSNVPVQVSGLTTGATAVAAGTTQTCAVVSGGAQCWGANSNGELGDGTSNASSVPVQVSGLTSSVTAIACGGSFSTGGFSCAVANGGTQCWGANFDGELGNGTRTTKSLVAVPVSGL
jgi:hypothetical protein